MHFSTFVEQHCPHEYLKSTDRGDQRYGQWLMNRLFLSNPKTHSEILGTDEDPFYDDLKLPRFWKKLGVVWE